MALFKLETFCGIEMMVSEGDYYVQNSEGKFLLSAMPIWNYNSMYVRNEKPVWVSEMEFAQRMTLKAAKETCWKLGLSEFGKMNCKPFKRKGN